MAIATTAPRTASRAATRPLFTGQSTTGPGVPQRSADNIMQDIAALVHIHFGPATTPGQRDAFLAELRATWCGGSHYIDKALGDVIQKRNAAIRRAHSQGMRVGAIMRAHHVSRATVYRALGMPDDHSAASN